MRALCGTSGFSYKEWKGNFYPADLPDNQMLSYYAERLPTVEINNTFYRMPKAAMLQKWTAQVPDGFVFVIKASRRITHAKGRLKEVDDSLLYLWDQVQGLDRHLGPILFQLPPFFRKDIQLLREFLGKLPTGLRAVFEFRHQTWADDEVHAALQGAGCALCTADTHKDIAETPLVPTADWGYLRLRRETYSEDELQTLAARVRQQAWKEVFVFFKHEDEGAAPRLAARLASLLGKN
ncbi:MAG: DUF72 domain-containing protein [Planctomycetota bacterium]|jgi:uncharacterized protein YecE (DUF72 family)